MLRRELLSIGIAFAFPFRAMAQAPRGPVPIPAEQIAPKDAPSHVVVGPSEPGARLIVRGRVTDGTRPMQAASIFIYQADFKGFYSADGKDHKADHASISRLRGTLRADTQGYYSYETSIPGSYGGPQHVHYVVSAPGYRDRRIEMWLEGEGLHRVSRDPYPNYPNPDFLLSIQPATLDAKGVWHVTQDIVLVKS